MTVLKYKFGINSDLTKHVLPTKTLVGPDSFDMRETRDLINVIIKNDLQVQ